MTATVMTFRRDLKKVLRDLATFNTPPTVEEMHQRLEQCILALNEAWAQHDSGLIKYELISQITSIKNGLATIACRAGAKMDDVEKFHKERRDWLEFRTTFKAAKKL